MKNAIIICVVFFALVLSSTGAFAIEAYLIYLSPIPPLVMKQGDRHHGLLWDVAQVLKDRVNADCDCQVKVQVLPWKRAYNYLQTSENVVMLQMARSDKRENLMHWMAPTSNLSFAFVTTKKQAPVSLEEAHALPRIAVYRDSRLESFLRSKGFDENLVAAKDSETSLKLLEAGRVDAWYGSVQEVEWFIAAGKTHMALQIGPSIMRFPLWGVASRGMPEQGLMSFKHHLQNMEYDGTLAQLNERYGLSLAR